MKKYSTRIKNDFAEALIKVISDTIVQLPQSIDMEAEDRMFLAGLEEVRIALQRKMISYRPEYPVTFTPVQALALQILFQRTQLGNIHTLVTLHTIANEIEHQYQ